MNHRQNITKIILGTTLLVGCWTLNRPLQAKTNNELENTCNKFFLTSELLPTLKKNTIITISKVRPFEILDRQATSYADITLQLTNNQDKAAAIEITAIEIVDLASNQVLLTSDTMLTAVGQSYPEKQHPKFPVSIALAPKEKTSFSYRLKSPSKLYQKGNKVYAKVYYRQDQQLLQKAILSSPQNVAFTIP